MKKLLQVKDLWSGYGQVNILRGVSIEVSPGELVALLGSNGAGKTTLNNTLCGLIKTRSGAIEFDGQEISGLHYKDIVRLGLIHVPEGRKIFPNLTVQENLQLGAYTRGSKNRSLNQTRVLDIFPRLKERLSQLAGTMSGGEQQMVAIARGLMAEPKLLILDEPSLGLSPLLVEEMFELIQSLKNTGLSILLVEQNVAQSLDIADKAYVIENGELKFSGEPSALLESDAMRQAYLGV
jgi:branched-chain amino acid transport system ATP-binding protein